MASKHPYITATNALIQIFDQLRKSFPNVLSADILKKLGLAANSEGLAINIIRFLGLIDDQNNRTDLAQKMFTLHDTGAFQEAFANQVRVAYSDLFDLHGDEAWSLDQIKLITFFRQNDQSTERVGREQTRTFKVLASYAGQGDALPQPRAKSLTRQKKKPVSKSPSVPIPKDVKDTAISNEPENTINFEAQTDKALALTVRIEINLPVTDNQETYDRIFKSIRENLLNG